MNKTMRYFAIVVLMLGSVSARAVTESYAITAGVESFLWQEFNESGSKLLDETGPRYFVAIEAEKRVSQDWSYGFLGKLYSGRVDYDGQTQSGTPLTTDTDYNGWMIEADFFQSLNSSNDPTRGGEWFVRYTLGYDNWRRNILGSGGYEEDYQVFYGRLGADYRSETGWRIQGGVKYPFNTIEDVGLTSVGYDKDPSLKPAGDFSLYFSARYRIHAHWDISAYYDSYRFKKSNQDTVQLGATLYNVWQPESWQDTLGVALSYYF